ncbi:hypothetical protein DSO57_1033560 [Entomophthora muscae]|uniref:Uncharacterized protein n=1 Tax=Entomophthora muscae TaxID=34485 RepID=A0ACC2REV0_9FUNG|nr:hypothetical protein DSO57_1033560 [Entomophthora muscae]
MKLSIILLSVVSITSSLEICQGNVVANATNSQELSECFEIKGDLTISNLGESTFPLLKKVAGSLVVRGLSSKIRGPGDRAGQQVYRTKEAFPKL